MDGETLAGLIRGAQAGEPAAFDRLVEAFASRIFGFVLRMTGSRDDAEDLTQEVFLRVVRMIGAYRHDDRFEAWLFRIAANLVRDRVRRSSRAPRRAAVAFEDTATDGAGMIPQSAGGRPGQSEAADARLIRTEEVDALNVALTMLTGAEREVIMLRHFGGLSFKEIAELMGTPLGTALARAHRGLTRLRELMSATPKQGRQRSAAETIGLDRARLGNGGT